MVGPTAIGKTRAGVSIAQHFNAEIISADSRQFYKEMNVGTAKPVAEEQKGIYHHFVDFLSVTESYTVGDFERDVDQLLLEYFQNNNIAVLVGGSGLFVDAVCMGLDEFPEVNISIKDSLNAQFIQEGLAPLLQKLKELDRPYYDMVDRSNHRRVIRALEVSVSTGKPFSSFLSPSSKEDKYHVIRIGLEMKRELLFERINNRVDGMINAGLLDEVTSLVKYRDMRALQTVGYKELFGYLEGEISLQDAVEQIKNNTRKYCKRRLTWFRKNKAINWFPADDPSKIISFIETRLREFQ